jgi:pSer/pThr/pTyr-binding forkhead associated (FHA) protein
MPYAPALRSVFYSDARQTCSRPVRASDAARIRRGTHHRVRFEVRFPDGAPHEVELQGRLVVVGRDPSCDLVLHDVKCSRRHAVVEAGPDGIVIRDTGSANGVFVNDQKVERAPLKTGDTVRLGDSVVKVLPEEVEGTIVMGPADTGAGEATVGDDSQPPPLPPRPAPAAPRAVSPPPLPGPEAPLPEVVEEEEGEQAEEDALAPAHRPLTVNVLAALWLMSVPMYALGGLAFAARTTGVSAVLVAGLGLGLAVLAAALAWGLWSLKPWARGLQIAVAALGVLVCPFTLASVVVLAYMLMPPGASAFSPDPPVAETGPRRETGFTAALLGTVLLGALLSMVFLLLPRLASRLS